MNISEKINSTNKRRKITINRDKILQCVEKIIDLNNEFKGYLEFEYAGESGSGTGPTLEFYSLVFEKIKEKKILWYNTTDLSLFPLPIGCRKTSREENEKFFVILGYVIARGIYDDRLIDIQLNPLFWDIVLEKVNKIFLFLLKFLKNYLFKIIQPITIQKLSLIDKDLAKVLNDLINLSEKKKIILENFQSEKNSNQQNIQTENKIQISKSEEITNLNFINLPNKLENNQQDNFNLENKLLYNSTKIKDIGITFILPGYEDIELKPNGSDILLDAVNLEEYINLVFKTLCFEGINDSVKAFKKGFSLVFPIKSLRCFHSSEISDLLCGGNMETWNQDILTNAVVPNHGYDKKK